MEKSKHYERYVEHLKKLADVESAIAVLSWDKEVNLPPKGAKIRAQQVATLSGIAHEIFADESLGELLEQLTDQPEGLTGRQKYNVLLSLKDYNKVRRLDKEFVMRRSRIISEGYHAWLEARQANDWSAFRDPLTELVRIKREEAERLGYEEHPYDILMDEFEPEVRCSHLDGLFRDVRDQLVDFVREIRQRPQVDDAFLHRFYPKDKQWDFGLEMLRRIGYDFQAGRQDLSPHPFTVSFGPADVRVTTRIDEHNFAGMTWSCIHEGGHALYEQGLPQDDYGLPSGRFLSLGIHESQSRLWENNVGRSLPFWRAHYPDLQAIFPEALADIPLDHFFRAINKIEPSLIRTESDELHYHFHVLIRYELEKALIEGSLEVRDLRDAWNEKYKDYLDLDVPDDRRGLLQDIHWAHGSFGYFPTYSLGSFYAAQFYHQAEKDIPGLEPEMEKGNTQPLLDWLRENIHRHGRTSTAEERCRRITGEPLHFRFFMDYARRKYQQVYGH